MFCIEIYVVMALHEGCYGSHLTTTKIVQKYKNSLSSCTDVNFKTYSFFSLIPIIKCVKSMAPRVLCLKFCNGKSLDILS